MPLWKSAPQVLSNTRFDTNTDLKELPPLIKELSDKEAELNKASAEVGMGQIDSVKHEAVANLLRNLRARIDVFNAGVKNANRDEELKEIQPLIKDLLKIVNTELAKNEETFKICRNNQRKIASLTAQGIFVVPAVLVSTFEPLSFPVGVATTGGAKIVGEGVKALTGLNDLTAKSFLIVQNLKEKLTAIDENVAKYFATKSPSLKVG